MENTIIVDTNENPSKLKFTNEKTSIETDVLIGRNGVTSSKKEGDGKTPLGTFELGIVFGTHNKGEIYEYETSIEYIKINENLYWVDDVKSKCYNQLIDITKVDVEWKSAEHLIDYPVQYEYAIEIRTNPENIPGKGSAIFIHCSNGVPTAGCIALPKEEMIKLIKQINRNTRIIIR